MEFLRCEKPNCMFNTRGKSDDSVVEVLSCSKPLCQI